MNVNGFDRFGLALSFNFVRGLLSSDQRKLNPSDLSSIFNVTKYLEHLGTLVGLDPKKLDYRDSKIRYGFRKNNFPLVLKSPKS